MQNKKSNTKTISENKMKNIGKRKLEEKII